MTATGQDLAVRVGRHDVAGLLEAGGDEAVDLLHGRQGRVLGGVTDALGNRGHERHDLEHLGEFEIEPGTKDVSLAEELVAQVLVLHLVEGGDGHVGAADTAVAVGPEFTLGIDVVVHQVVPGLGFGVVHATAAVLVVGAEVGLHDIAGAGVVAQVQVERSVDTCHELHGILFGGREITRVALGIADRVQEFLASREGKQGRGNGEKSYDSLFHDALELNVNTNEESPGSRIEAHVDAGSPVVVGALAHFGIHTGVAGDGQEVLG